MNCNDCPYFYQEAGEGTPYCHFESDEWLDNTAPCERVDDYEGE